MKRIEYDHERNRHTLEGAIAALEVLIGDAKPSSLLDVGCGPGTWLAAARHCGIEQLLGVDGVKLPEDELQVDKQFFLKANLEEPWRADRRFDVALCLEVAEHLSASAASTLITTLTEHSNRIYFSAAAPHQEGQHHVNCQWPEYWQELFNKAGYRCEDSIRPRIWMNERIEWWYRQNTFVAIRDGNEAGKEPRILPMVHPASFNGVPFPTTSEFRNQILQQIDCGSEPIAWYLSLPFRGIIANVRRC